MSFPVNHPWVTFFLGLVGISAATHEIAKMVAKGGPYTLTPGHMYLLSYRVGANAGQGAAPDQNGAQLALNKSMPGLWDVISSNAGTMAGSFNLNAVFSGPAALHASANDLSSGFGGAATITSSQDMGAAPPPAAQLGL